MRATAGTGAHRGIQAISRQALQRKVAAFKRRVGTPGITRTGGYYGRFAGRNAEKKFFDGTLGSTACAAAGTILNASLNLIPQGVTESTRVGRKCVVKNLNMKGHVILPATTTAASTSDIVRVIVYLDKQCNGATAGVTDILEATDIESFRNLANSQRFVVMYDKTKTINLSGCGLAATDTWAERVIPFKFSKACNIPLEFDSTTGAITEIRSNNIGVLGISESGLVAIQYRWRMRFSDGS